MADRRLYGTGTGESDPDDGDDWPLQEIAEQLQDSLKFGVAALERIRDLTERVLALEAEAADWRAAARSKLWLPPA